MRLLRALRSFELRRYGDGLEEKCQSAGLVFPGRDVRALCDQDPQFGYCFMRYGFETVARRLTDARLQLLDVYGHRS